MNLGEELTLEWRSFVLQDEFLPLEDEFLLLEVQKSALNLQKFLP